MAVSPSVKRGAARPLIVVLIVIVVVAVLGYGYASPYLALNQLKRAADARDAATVNQYVDYPALRQSLKDQVGGLLTRRIEARGNGNPFAAIGAMIGVALIGPLVDAYATPDGVAALLNGMPPRGVPGERPPAPSPDGENGEASTHHDTPPSAPPVASSAPATPPPVAGHDTPPQPPQTTAGYRGINEFVVTYQHGVGDVRYAAIFQRNGLFSWKLSAVDLNG